MDSADSLFTEAEKDAIISAAKKPNGDFDYATFLRLLQEAKRRKGVAE